MSKPTRRDVAGLLTPEEIAGAAHFEIERRNLKAASELRVAFERLDSRARLVVHRVGRWDDEVAVRALLASADPPAKLIKLREAEEVRAIDDHRVGAGDVEAALDDRGRREDVVAAVDEIEHRLFQSGLAHLPVRDGDARRGHELVEPLRLLVKLIDAVVDVEALARRATSSRCTASRTTCSSQRVTMVRTARRSTGAVVMSERSRIPVTAICSVRGIGVAVSVRTSTCARSCLMRSLWATPKRCSSSTTRSPRCLEVHVLREEPVRADDDVDLAVLQADDRLVLLLLRLEA